MTKAEKRLQQASASAEARIGHAKGGMMRSSDELIREFVVIREHRDRLRRERAGLFCSRAEPVTEDDYREAQAEAQAGQVAGFEFPQATQEQACWKAARKWDDTGYRARLYFNPPMSEWCEHCRRRQAVNDAYREAVRRHAGALRGLIARGKAQLRALGAAHLVDVALSPAVREAGCAEAIPTLPDGESIEP
jgi:hypothetical protein